MAARPSTPFYSLQAVFPVYRREDPSRELGERELARRFTYLLPFTMFLTKWVRGTPRDMVRQDIRAQAAADQDAPLRYPRSSERTVSATVAPFAPFGGTG